MRYETLLFTRNQRADFTTFIRPSLLTNKDVSTIGSIFNYVSDISRLTADFPSLYYFPLGEYLLLLRHYDSGRKHAGRAIGTIEGVAIRRSDSAALTDALPQLVEQQATLLAVSAGVADIEAQEPAAASEQTCSAPTAAHEQEAFAAAFLARRDADRLFLPFTPDGRAMLVNVVGDTRFPTPPFFAFGTNSDVLAQLERQAPVDIVSFFKTDSASFRSRKTNRVVQVIDGATTASAEGLIALRPHPADEMHLRPIVSGDEMQLRAHPAAAEADPEAAEETWVGADAISLRTIRHKPPISVDETDEVDAIAAIAADPDAADEDEDSEATVLTMRQLRDQLRAEEAAAAEAEPQPAQPRPRDPLHWLLHLVASIITPNKPK